ncbi:MAG: hypothetical protein ACXWZE_15605, partial [Candidatus Binatia bacterium]
RHQSHKKPVPFHLFHLLSSQDSPKDLGTNAHRNSSAMNELTIWPRKSGENISSMQYSPGLFRVNAN